jgi:chromosomal replication initiator protein
LTIWDAVLGRIETKVNRYSYYAWFKSTSLFDDQGSTIAVRVPSVMVVEWLTKHYTSVIDEALAEVGRKGATLRYVPDGAEPIPSPAVARAEPQQAERADPEVTFGMAPPSDVAEQVGLSPRIPSTRSSSARRINSRMPRAARWPKRRRDRTTRCFSMAAWGSARRTDARDRSLRADAQLEPEADVHLSRAVHERSDQRDSLRSHSRISRTVSQRGCAARRRRAVHRRQGAHADGVLSHVQRAARRPETDRPQQRLPAAQITELEERLRSRFEWGLIADIQPPDLETKIAILKRKAEAEGVPLPDPVALYIAGRIKSNIRELEGSLIRLLAYASLTGREVTMALAQEVLRDVLRHEERVVTIDMIQKFVADYYQLKPIELKSRNNSKSVAVPRQIAMYLCKQLTNASLPEIGKSFGGKHHSTVIHSVRKVDSQRQADPAFNTLVDSFVESFR